MFACFRNKKKGSAMILRMVDHLLQYGGVQVCRGVPLCLGLLYASAPKPVVVEVLCKLTHDSESQVALNAIFALGLVGAGQFSFKKKKKNINCFYLQEPTIPE
jgi:26S proteasome regulatory subunit N1